MASRDPKTRHVRAAELRAQLDQLFDQAATRAYDRASLRELAVQDRPKSERTATHIDVSAAQQLAMPTLGNGRPEERGPVPRHKERPPTRPASRSSASSKPTRLRLLLLSTAAAMAVVVAMGLPGGSAHSAPSVQTQAPTERGVSSSARVAPTGGNQVSDRGAPSGTEHSDWESTPTPQVDSVAAQPADIGKVGDPPLEAAAEPSSASSQHVERGTIKQAVGHLLAGRTRDALVHYRALSREPGAPAELAIVATLLEAELRRCASELQEGSACAP